MTILEKVNADQIAHKSGIQAGDFLIAINEHDLTNQPAMTALKVLSFVSFPKVLVFESRYIVNDAKMIEESILSRSYTLQVLYPPGLMSSLSVRLAEWSLPFIDAAGSRDDACPVLRLRAPTDTFGCQVNQTELQLSTWHQTINNGDTTLIGTPAQAASEVWSNLNINKLFIYDFSLYPYDI